MLIYQSHDAPERVLNAISELGHPNVTEIAFQVSYITSQGCEILFPLLERNIGNTWQNINKTIITTLDYGITRPQALEHLLNEVPNINIFATNSPDHFERIIRPRPTFHPKIYSFASGGNEISAVGSANLTESALTINTEAISINESNIIFQNLQYQIRNLFPVNQQYIELYKEFLRERAINRPEIETPLPRVERPQGEQFRNLYFNIQQNNIDPSQMDNFWLECGSMSSGGSRNQLELPRGACHFFNLPLANYEEIEQAEHIGNPILLSGTNAWNNKRLTWHGNNRMERLNLPTQSQGGFNYQDMVILFHRRNHGFEIRIAPANSTQANNWIAASGRTNNIYQISRTRICGFFN